uniref:Uncharacterized protein n=1 Tax=Phocoena sinus TaxID=42100 RepID=A0A8C9ED37_PHOSS
MVCSASVSGFAPVFGFSPWPPKTNQFFGKAKPKAPPPSLTDCTGTVDSRAESTDKICRLDAELEQTPQCPPHLEELATPRLSRLPPPSPPSPPRLL